MQMSITQISRPSCRIGVTPVRYYMNLRLDQARGLVTQTELPISDIAALSGCSPR